VADELTPVASLVQRIITTTAGACLGVIVIWQVSTLADVKERVGIIESQSNPPRHVTLRLDHLEADTKRCKARLERVEGNHGSIDPNGWTLGESG
jgi:hypothetical protein